MLESGVRDSVSVGKHKMTLESRKNCKLTGVTDALSFDEKQVMLETVDGMLEIRGNDMHVSRLDLDRGELDMEGVIDQMIYTDKNSFLKKGEGLWTRLFS